MRSAAACPAGGLSATRDAAYLALAEALGAPLLTTDRKLAEVPGHAARVEEVAQAGH